MKTIFSLQDFQLVLKNEGPSKALIQGEFFFREATTKRDIATREVLIDVARRFPENSPIALAWLSQYEDVTLIPVLLDFLDRHPTLRQEALIVLENWTAKQIILAGDALVGEALVRLLSEKLPRATHKTLIGAVKFQQIWAAFDWLLASLTHADHEIRIRAASAVLEFLKTHKNEEALAQVMTLLNDPVPIVRAMVAVSLRAYDPQKFSNLDIDDYMHQAYPDRKD